MVYTRKYTLRFTVEKNYDRAMTSSSNVSRLQLRSSSICAYLVYDKINFRERKQRARDEIIFLRRRLESSDNHRPITRAAYYPRV